MYFDKEEKTCRQQPDTYMYRDSTETERNLLFLYYHPTITKLV